MSATSFSFGELVLAPNTTAVVEQRFPLAVRGECLATQADARVMLRNRHDEDRPVRTVSIVPTWRGILPLLVEVAANGTTATARRNAMEELYRLADKVDAMNAEASE